VCGCDPYADKVIATLQEAGHLPEKCVDHPTAKHDWVCETCAEITDPAASAGSTPAREEQEGETYKPMPPPCGFPERKCLLGFEADNHHNALTCPYCNPKGLRLVDPASLPVPADLVTALKELRAETPSNARDLRGGKGTMRKDAAMNAFGWLACAAIGLLVGVLALGFYTMFSAIVGHEI
jgi:hypothetical protein